MQVLLDIELLVNLWIRWLLARMLV